MRVLSKFAREQAGVRQWVGVWLPAYLFFVGLSLQVFASAAGFLAAAAFASAGAVCALYLLVFRLKEIRFSWVMGTGLLLGYAGGSLNTDIALLKDGTNLAEFTGHAQSDMSFALMIAIWVSAALMVSGTLIEKPVKLNLQKIERTDMRLIWGSIALILAAFASGRFGYMGTQYSEDNHVSPLSDFAGMLCGVLPAVTFLFEPANPTKSRRMLTYGLVILEFLMILPTGRRALIYSLLVAVLAFNLRHAKSHVPLKTKVGLFICACFVMYPGLKFFYAMRVMTWRIGSYRGVSVLTLAKGAYKIMSEGDPEFEDSYRENIKTRTSIISYLSEMLEANRTYSPLYGQDLLFCIKLAIPSVIYKNKADVLMMEEQVTNPQFGLPVRDDANSILTTGIADFGLFGCFLYPLLVPLVFSFCVRTIQKKTLEPAAAFATSISLALLFQAEISGTGCTGVWRDLVLMTGLMMLVKKIPTLRSRVNSRHFNKSGYLRAPAYTQADLPVPPL